MHVVNIDNMLGPACPICEAVEEVPMRWEGSAWVCPACGHRDEEEDEDDE